MNFYCIVFFYLFFLLDGLWEVCLFVSDWGIGLKQKEVKVKVVEEGIFVQKVIVLLKLKKNYFVYEEKWMLCGLYDLFLLDDRILLELLKCIGKVFFKKKKYLILVILGKGQWKGQIVVVCNFIYLYIGGGICSVVKVVRVLQIKDEIRENVKVVIEGIVVVILKKWKNIQFLFLKIVEFVLFLFYQVFLDLLLRIEVEKKIGKQDLYVVYNGKLVDKGEWVFKKRKVGGFESGRKKLRFWLVVENRVVLV